MPPLRSRRDDIPALWRHFVSRFAEGADIETEPALMERLMSLPWKGNVRELANLCQRMIVLRKGETLRLEDAPPEVRRAVPSGEKAAVSGWVGPMPEESLPLWDVEREIIRLALAKFGGNKTRAAKYLDIPRHVLIYRIEKYALGEKEQ